MFRSWSFFSVLQLLHTHKQNKKRELLSLGRLRIFLLIQQNFKSCVRRASRINAVPLFYSSHHKKQWRNIKTNRTAITIDVLPFSDFTSSWVNLIIRDIMELVLNFNGFRRQEAPEYKATTLKRFPAITLSQIPSSLVKKCHSHLLMHIYVTAAAAGLSCCLFPLSTQFTSMSESAPLRRHYCDFSTKLLAAILIAFLTDPVLVDSSDM